MNTRNACASVLYALLLLQPLAYGLPVASTASDNPKQSGTDTDHNVQTNSALTEMHPVQAEEEFGKLKPMDRQPEGFFNDRLAKIPKRLKRQSPGLQPLRSISIVGPQPLRALIQDDPAPSKRSQPRLKISLDDNADLRQDVISAVERHLLDDLEAARDYGIRPEEILQDLRQRQKTAPVNM